MAVVKVMVLVSVTKATEINALKIVFTSVKFYSPSDYKLHAF
jgi:hypothetical protein